MNRTSTTLVVVMAISSLGMWGCTHQKNGATNAKIRELEARYAKVEEDYRVVVAANEGHRKKILGLERQRDELIRQVDELKSIASERDDFRKQLGARTQERDTLHGNLQQLGKDLQALVGRVEAAASAVPVPSVTTAVQTSRRTP